MEDSLQRLGLASIDIVYIHDLGPENTELPRPWTRAYEIARSGAMVELERMRNESLIKAWGFGINRPDAAVTPQAPHFDRKQTVPDFAAMLARSGARRIEAEQSVAKALLAFDANSIASAVTKDVHNSVAAAFAEE
ncbi:hypothetical protein ASG42_23025 [Rhizobium sp. Leaf391]|nr:hypothetical protein ASG42_23025 [Rhizobium sp. Leaf391]